MGENAALKEMACELDALVWVAAHSAAGPIERRREQETDEPRAFSAAALPRAPSRSAQHYIRNRSRGSERDGETIGRAPHELHKLGRRR